MSEKKLSKKNITVFGDNYCFLGRGEDGTSYWLQEPSWDCDWYWGIGYIESFTNNDQPELSEDIDSHTHFDYEIFGKDTDSYEKFKEIFCDNPFTDKEIWQILELMKTAYTLNDTAEIYVMGGSHYTESPCEDILKDSRAAAKINEELLPKIFEALWNILTK